MVDALIMLFDDGGGSWEWPETLPAMPRVGDTLCIDELEDRNGTPHYDVRCTVSEVTWWLGGDEAHVHVIADIEGKLEHGHNG